MNDRNESDALWLLDEFESLDDAFLPHVDVPDDAETQATASASSTSTQLGVKRCRKRGFNPNRARDERKEEVLYLRQRVHEMEATLEQLKSRYLRHAVALGHSPLRPNLRVQPAGFSSSPWESVALHQYAERQRVEMENVRLKMLLEDQIKVARGLEKLLNRRTNAQVRIPFSLRRIALIPPFDVQATSAAVWKHLLVLFERMPLRNYYERQQKNACIQKMQVTDDTIVESFHVFQHATRTTARFHARQVLRRYTEQDRILIVWRMMVDPVEFSSQPTSGIRFSELGYMVIKRPTSSSSEEHSHMQTCVIMTPQHFDKNPDPEHKIGQISNFFLDSIAQNIYESQKMIQNVLMDESLERRMVSVV